MNNTSRDKVSGLSLCAGVIRLGLLSTAAGLIYPPIPPPTALHSHQPLSPPPTPESSLPKPGSVRIGTRSKVGPGGEYMAAAGPTCSIKELQKPESGGGKEGVLVGIREKHS